VCVSDPIYKYIYIYIYRAKYTFRCYGKQPTWFVFVLNPHLC